MVYLPSFVLELVGDAAVTIPGKLQADGFNGVC